MLVWALLSIASLASAATGNAKAGGAGYAYSFDGLMGTTISMQWAHAPISTMTVEYWMNIMVRAAAAHPRRPATAFTIPLTMHTYLTSYRHRLTHSLP